jgi:beta-glucanase (GH16 family)
MAGTLNLSGYKLTYDDEFNTFSSSPDGSTGHYKTSFYFGGRSLPSNGEHEFYSDSSVGTNPFSLHNGALDITAAPGGPAAYTSGLITTEKSFTQTYGYFEMRAELPQGQGMWPAFWLLAADKGWPPELDPLEAFGQTNAHGEGGSDKYHVGMISSNSSQSNGGWETINGNIYTGYHDYGVDWEPDHVTYYFDGQQVAQFNTPSDMNKPMYMLANVAVGGNWPGPEGNETSHMLVDYIRAYSENPNATAVALDHVSSPDGANTAPAGATVAGGSSDPTPSPAPAPAPAPTPAPSTGSSDPAGSDPVIGTGHDALVVNLSEDAYKGDAQFTVTVDGKEFVGSMSVNASHAAGASEAFTLKGDFGSGAHDVAVTFTNDLWNGTTSTDRNLYIDSADFNGQQVAGAAHSLLSNGTVHLAVAASAAPTPSPAPAPTPTPGPTSEPGDGGSFGSGPDALVVTLSEDAYKGDAQFTLTVDGKAIDGAHSVTASHAGGAMEAFTFNGDFGSGTHDVAITFTNDAWGGTTSTDRNLYVDNVSLNGHEVADASHALYSNGTVHLSVTGGSDPTTGSSDPGTGNSGTGNTGTGNSGAGASDPGTSDPGASDPGTGGTDTAVATPDVARHYVAPDASGTAHGTSGADDIFVTGAHQTLVGGGGDDIFHLGSYTDATIHVGGSGTTTVSTWATHYTLADGVNDLTLAGNYAHTASGNALDNFITGSAGNDTLNGGAGNDIIQVGTGSNTLTGGAGHDMFVFPKAADHDNMVTDFQAGQDVLDFRGLLQDAGYHGTNPVADHVLQLTQHGADTVVTIDPSANGHAHTLVTLHDVVASSLHAGTDYLWH